MELGRTFDVWFSKRSPTLGLFDRIYNKCHKFGDYDTLILRNIFIMSKRNLIGIESVLVTFYFQNSAESDLNIDIMTIQTLKNRYCGKRIGASLDSEDDLIKRISSVFLNKTYNENGDFFFESTFSIRAQTYYHRESLGFGRTAVFDIVGVNLKPVDATKWRFQ